MNKTGLMLRDAAYIAAIINRSAGGIPEEERQRGERIILRLLHRNKLSFIDVVRILFRELEDAGITLNDKRSVDLMQARLYNLIRQSCGIADENNKTIIKKENNKNGNY